MTYTKISVFEIGSANPFVFRINSAKSFNIRIEFVKSFVIRINLSEIPQKSSLLTADR